jgi:hypothetical protein
MASSAGSTLPDSALPGPALPSRSTSATGRAVLADAVRAVAPALADEVLATSNWRSGYLRPFREMTRLALVPPGAAASRAPCSGSRWRSGWCSAARETPLDAGRL